MKKAIITLAITAFITGTVIVIVQTPSTTAANSQEQIGLAQHQIYQSLKDSLQQFNKESNDKIVKYEVSIVEYKTRIANEKKENKIRTTNKVAELYK